MKAKTGSRRRRVEQIAGKLTRKHKGKFAAIDPESGRYFLGSDHLDVILRAHEALPKTIFAVKRLGFPYTLSLKPVSRS